MNSPAGTSTSEIPKPSTNWGGNGVIVAVGVNVGIGVGDEVNVSVGVALGRGVSDGSGVGVVEGLAGWTRVLVGRNGEIDFIGIAVGCEVGLACAVQLTTLVASKNTAIQNGMSFIRFIPSIIRADLPIRRFVVTAQEVWIFGGGWVVKQPTHLH